VGWSIILNLLLLPRLDVDTYHDGFIYPMALRSSEGFITNKDFFSLYGPIAPTLSGIWLKVFGEGVLALRLYGAFMVISISILLFLMVRKMHHVYSALVLSILWAIGNPLIVHPSLPWVDLHTTLLIMTAMYLILNTPLGNASNNRVSFVTGTLIGIGIFIKINFGLVASLIILLVAVFFGKKSALFTLLGSFLSVATALFLVLNGALVPYFEQTIYFAWLQHDEGKQLRGVVNVKSIVFGSLLILLLFLYRKLKSRYLVKIRLIHKVILVLASSAFWTLVSLEFRRINEPFRAFSEAPSEVLQNLLKNAPYFPMFSSIFILPALFIVLMLFGKKIGVDKNDSDRKYYFVAILGTSYILQLYPNPEPGHIWYLFPGLVVGIAAVVLLLRLGGVFESTTKFLIAPTIFALLVINLQFLSVERLSHKQSPLIGMKSNPYVTTAIDDSLESLKLNVASGSVNFNCPRGVYSVFSNTYYASDYQYVDIVPRFYKKKAFAPLVFECDKNANEIMDIRSKFEVIFESQSEIKGFKNILYKVP
jgi:hypothetical protein